MGNNNQPAGDLTIIVCCHKQDYHHEGPGFLPIHVGKAISKVELGIQGDDTGDSISAKNPNFCELTGHYWLWKNGPKSKYVGLNHYRRYFDFTRKLPYGTTTYDTTSEEIDKDFPGVPDLDSVFSKYDVVVAKPRIHPFCGATHYKLYCISNDLFKLEDVIKEKYPDYWSSYRDVMYRNNKISHCNMFIMKNELFQDYSAWLFDILFEVEKRVIISKYPDQARIFGYMSEYLLNVYIHHHDLKAKKVPVAVVRDTVDDDRKIKEYTKNLINAIRNNFLQYIRPL